MGFATYRAVLGIRSVRHVLLLGLVIRIPMWAGAVILTLHVVGGLHHSYTVAGVAVAASTTAAAISGPWRGRLLDRRGLRATMLPSLVVLTLCWSIAPWVGIWALLPLVAVAGLFVLPTFSIVRQIMISSVPEEHRKTALVLDSVAVEVSFMAGPALGVLAATTLATSWALLLAELLSVAGGLVLFLLNPALVDADVAADARAQRPRVRDWMTPTAAVVIMAAGIATVVLTGTDLGTVAAMRDMGRPAMIGLVMAVWGLGSAVGGLAYGALRRSIPAFWLLLGLGVATVPVALAPNPPVFGLALGVAGLFCAPTITATLDHLSRVVPARVRGEAIGWHGSALTTGSAAGAPLIGIVIDHGGWQSGFIVAGGIGILLAAAGLVVLSGRSRRGVRAASHRVDPRAHHDLGSTPRSVSLSSSRSGDDPVQSTGGRGVSSSGPPRRSSSSMPATPVRADPITSTTASE